MKTREKRKPRIIVWDIMAGLKRSTGQTVFKTAINPFKYILQAKLKSDKSTICHILSNDTTITKKTEHQK